VLRACLLYQEEKTAVMKKEGRT